MSPRISVVGGGTITGAEADRAEAVGRELGDRDHTVVCGGLGGTMEAVCRGAKAAGGETIGVLPVEDRAAANEHVDTAIATGLGHARNAIVALNGDGVIALSGGPGTLSEIGFALVYGRPVVGLGTHEVEGLEIEPAATPAEAVDQIEAALHHEG